MFSGSWLSAVVHCKLAMANSVFLVPNSNGSPYKQYAISLVCHHVCHVVAEKLDLSACTIFACLLALLQAICQGRGRVVCHATI